MSIMELGALGEFVGSIAVVITLLFLAIQVRHGNTALKHNSSLVRAQVKQASSQSHNGIIDLWLTDDALRRLLEKTVNMRFEDLEEDERGKCSLMFLRVMRNVGDDFHRYDLGLFKEEEWGESKKWVDFYVANKAFRGWWTDEGHIGTAHFVDYVNQQISLFRRQSALPSKNTST